MPGGPERPKPSKWKPLELDRLHLAYWVLGTAVLAAVGGGMEKRFLSLGGRCAAMADTIEGVPQRAVYGPFAWHQAGQRASPKPRAEMSEAELLTADRRAGLCETMERQCPSVPTATRKHCRVLQG